MAIMLALLVSLLSLALAAQPVRAASGATWDVVPNKGFFLPGEKATWTLSLTLPAVAVAEAEASGTTIMPELTAEFRLYELTQPLTTVSGLIVVDPQAAKRSLDGKTVVWSWEFSWVTPADRPIAVGMDWTVRTASGEQVAEGSSAFDTAWRWVDIPRYGFLSDFDPSRGRMSPISELLPYHITGLQFYDWMYRHHQYLPPTPVFMDPLGRRLSLKVVESRIQDAHKAGMAAMAYTAIYAASPDFYQQHPDWALYKGPFTPWTFGDNFLYILNPARTSPWHDWIIDQYKQVVAWGFDGIHADQYGDPKNGFTTELAEATSFIDLGPAIRDLLTDAKEALAGLDLSDRHPGTGGDPALIFNAVNDWPTPLVAASKVDALYVEVWPPNDTYADIHRIVTEGLRLGKGRPQIIAAYLDPANVPGVLLLDAVIFASGGYHIELGEFNRMLADPYFPKHKPVGKELTVALRRYYDFSVRYRPLLYGELSTKGRDAGVTEGIFPGRVKVLAEGVRVGTTFSAGEVTVMTRLVAGYPVVHLINLNGVSSSRWRETKETPRPVNNLEVRFYPSEWPAGGPGELPRFFWASPDGDLRPHELPVTKGQDEDGRFISLRVPSVCYWTMVWMER
ncbi:MAG: hypothetical protein IMX00_08140 [Limnochordales bacterium]|nr:hypothetical protein [Limnochordales bacterium]